MTPFCRPVCPSPAQQDIDQLVRAQAKTVEEREALRQRLEKEAADRDSILQQKSMLQDKLKAMQEKLIQVRGLKSWKEEKGRSEGLLSCTLEHSQVDSSNGFRCALDLERCPCMSIRLVGGGV